MSNRWDPRRNVDLPAGPFAFRSRQGGNAPRVGSMQADPPSEAIDAVDVALARQELLAAANASNPLARAIILRLAASILRQAKGNKMPGGDLPVAGRERGSAADKHGPIRYKAEA